VDVLANETIVCEDPSGAAGAATTLGSGVFGGAGDLEGVGTGALCAAGAGDLDGTGAGGLDEAGVGVAGDWTATGAGDLGGIGSLTAPGGSCALPGKTMGSGDLAGGETGGSCCSFANGVAILPTFLAGVGDGGLLAALSSSRFAHISATLVFLSGTGDGGSRDEGDATCSVSCADALTRDSTKPRPFSLLRDGVGFFSTEGLRKARETLLFGMICCVAGARGGSGRARKLGAGTTAAWEVLLGVVAGETWVR